MACNDDDDDDKEGKIKKSFAIFFPLLFLPPTSSQSCYQQFHLKGVLLPDRLRNGVVKYRKDA